MMLAGLIQKGGLVRAATATAATVATQTGKSVGPVATVATVAVASPPTAGTAAARHWRVGYPGLDPMEVIFTPDATPTEVAAVYRGAEIKPLPEPHRQPATVLEAAELRLLIAGAFVGATDADLAEALQVALPDPDGALACYRAMAKSTERPVTR
jgi:hypothetical protein